MRALVSRVHAFGIFIKERKKHVTSTLCNVGGRSRLRTCNHLVKPLIHNLTLSDSDTSSKYYQYVLDLFAECLSACNTRTTMDEWGDAGRILWLVLKIPLKLLLFQSATIDR